MTKDTFGLNDALGLTLEALRSKSIAGYDDSAEIKRDTIAMMRGDAVEALQATCQHPTDELGVANQDGIITVECQSCSKQWDIHLEGK